MKSLRFMKTVMISAAILISLPAFAAEPTADSDIGNIDMEALAKILPSKPPYSPYAGRNFPTRPFFGDTHTHTSFSLDAGAAGARLGPAEALRFGKGEEITASRGQRVKLSRPLDFMVVADHSDGFGLFARLFAGDPELLTDPQIRKWYDMMQSAHDARIRRPVPNGCAIPVRPARSTRSR